MKKTAMLLMILLAMTMAVAFAGCGGDGEDVVTADNDQISFESTDLDGNVISSEELFAENPVTMVNVWGTFCGPCIEEMPEIEQINKEYAEQGAAVCGLVCDMPEGDDSLLQDALDIIDETGVTYLNLYWSSDMESQLNVTAVPTTFFVDSEGNLLGEPIVGADPDSYREALDEYLAQVD